jgi:hypothetical protein
MVGGVLTAFERAALLPSTRPGMCSAFPALVDLLEDQPVGWCEDVLAIDRLARHCLHLCAAAAGAVAALQARKMEQGLSPSHFVLVSRIPDQARIRRHLGDSHALAFDRTPGGCVDHFIDACRGLVLLQRHVEQRLRQPSATAFWSVPSMPANSVMAKSRSGFREYVGHPHAGRRP